MEIVDKISINKEFKLDEDRRCVVNIDFYDITFENRNQIEKSLDKFLELTSKMLKENAMNNIGRMACDISPNKNLYGNTRKA